MSYIIITDFYTNLLTFHQFPFPLTSFISHTTEEINAIQTKGGLNIRVKGKIVLEETHVKVFSAAFLGMMKDAFHKEKFYQHIHCFISFILFLKIYCNHLYKFT